MKLPLALMAALASSAGASACPFRSDADVANAWAGSEWILTSARHYHVENNGTNILTDRREARLRISPTLTESYLDGDAIDLVFQSRHMPATYEWETGNITFTDAYPDMSDASCAGTALSMILGQALVRLDRWEAELTLEVWVADADRMAGLIRVERVDAFDRLHARFAPFEGELVTP